MGTILSFTSPRLTYPSRKRSERSVDDLTLDQLTYDLRYRHGSTVSIGSHHGTTGTGNSQYRVRGHHQSVGETPQSSHRQRRYDPAHGKHGSRYPSSPGDWAARPPPPPPPPPPPHPGDMGRGRRPSVGRLAVEQPTRHQELDVRYLKDIENNNKTVWKRSQLMDTSTRTLSSFPKSTSCHTLATIDRVQLKNIANNNNNKATTKNRHQNYYHRFSCRIGDLAPPPPPPPPPLAGRLPPATRADQLVPHRARTSTVVGRVNSGGTAGQAGKTTVIQASTSELLR